MALCAVYVVKGSDLDQSFKCCFWLVWCALLPDPNLGMILTHLFMLQTDKTKFFIGLFDYQHLASIFLLAPMETAGAYLVFT